MEFDRLRWIQGRIRAPKLISQLRKLIDYLITQKRLKFNHS